MVCKYINAYGIKFSGGGTTIMKNLMMKIKSIVTNRTVLQVCTFALVVGSVAIGRCLPGYAHEPKLPNELIEK